MEGKMLLFLSMSFLVLQGNAEVFTSTQDLLTVFSLEQQVVSALSNYVSTAERRLDRIRRYLAQYEEAIPPAEESLERLAGSPIHIFHLMKRLTVELRHVKASGPPTNHWHSLVKALENDVIAEAFPQEEDLHGAARAIIRLQDVYDLNISSLVKGDILGVHSGAELDARDCLYIGKHSFNIGLYDRAIQWFDEAYTLAGAEANRTVSQQQILEFRNTAVKTKTEMMNKWTPLKESKKKDIDGYRALCRGEFLQGSLEKRGSTCVYDTRGSPHLLLSPAKVEIVQADPEILIFHDAISEREIELIKNVAIPTLGRALVQGHRGKGTSISNTRTSKTAWIDDFLHPALWALGRRVEHLTGLSTNVVRREAEIFQVCNYGIGGHYLPHHDFLLSDKTPEELKYNISPIELHMGDRVATFMFYLSDVERGGATVFPRLGVGIWPKKGAAAFWYNLKRSGSGNTDMVHGACPVVHGSKWVANKWIRERGQLRKRPCSLDPLL